LDISLKDEQLFQGLKDEKTPLSLDLSILEKWHRSCSFEKQITAKGKPMEKNLKQILIVDDEANVRVVFSDVLRRESYIVKVAKDGPEAIKAVDEETFDLALVDLRMPRMDGIEVLENIKKRKPQIPVIIYTGYGSITTAVEAMRKGAADYLNKPFSPEDLKSSIRKALEGAGEHNSTASPLSSGRQSYVPERR